MYWKRRLVPLVVLSLVVASLMPSGIVAAPSGPALLEDADCCPCPVPQVWYLGVQYLQEGGQWYTVFSYGTCSCPTRAISHVSLKICVPCGAVVAVSDPNWDCVLFDPQFGWASLKFETGYSGSTVEYRTIWFKLVGIYQPVPTEVGIKKGDSQEVWPTWGPDCTPTAVTLSNLEAFPGLRGVRVVWQTASEEENLGFDLYRQRANGLDARVKLNPELIPSQSPGGMVGADYEWFDGTAAEGVVYQYFLEAVDIYGFTEEYSMIGQWNAPVIVSLDPTDGSGRGPQVFNFVVGDTDKDLSIIEFVINGEPDLGGVAVRYDRVKDRFYLYNEANGKWLPAKGLIPGAANRKANKLVILKGKGCSVTENPDGSLAITLKLKFKRAFRGDYNVYISATDAPGNGTEVLVGTYTVP